MYLRRIEGKINVKFFILLGITLVSFFTYAKPSLIFSTTAKEESLEFKKMQMLAKAVSDKSSFNITLKYYPSHRASSLLKQGMIHAEIMQIGGYQSKVKSAIRIDVPITIAPLYVYSSMQKKFSVSGWQSLKKYRIVGVRGHHFIEQYMNQHDVNLVNTETSALRFLKARRADLYITYTPSLINLKIAKKSNMDSITKLEPPVDYTRSYSFFSANYPELAKEYEIVLNTLKYYGVVHQIMSLKH